MRGGPLGTSCQRGLNILVSTRAELGVPPAAHKREGPCTYLAFLHGFRNRFHPRYPAPSSGEVRTFQGDVERVERTSRERSDRNVWSRRELEPCAGSLNHAGKVVRLVRSFFGRCWTCCAGLVRAPLDGLASVYCGHTNGQNSGRDAMATTRQWYQSRGREQTSTSYTYRIYGGASYSLRHITTCTLPVRTCIP